MPTIDPPFGVQKSKAEAGAMTMTTAEEFVFS